MENTQLSLIPNNILQTKSKDLYENVKQQIEEGNVEIVEAFMFLKKLEKTFEKVNEDKDLKEQFQEAFDQQKEGKSVKKYGNRLTETNRSYYNYSECNDPELDELYEIERKVKSLIKSREEQIQLLYKQFTDNKNLFEIKKPEIVSNKSYKFKIKEEDTEVFQINLPSVKTKTSVSFYV